MHVLLLVGSRDDGPGCAAELQSVSALLPACLPACLAMPRAQEIVLLLLLLLCQMLMLVTVAAVATATLFSLT